MYKRTDVRPPALALFLLRLWLSATSYEAIAGDLCEEFRAEKHSRRWFWRQTLSTLRFRWRPTPAWAEIRGSENSLKEGSRATATVSTFGRDLWYAMRGLRAAPAFSLVVIGAIALGVGANTGIFTFVNALVLRRLPVADATRVVSVYQTMEGGTPRHVAGSDALFSYAEFQAYQEQAHTVEALTAFAPSIEATLTGKHAGLLKGDLVACNYFSVLGRNPQLGRGFTQGECQSTGNSREVVLSAAYWHSTFEADPRIVGRAIVLNGQPFTVIGVAPSGFRGAYMLVSDFWAPIAAQPLLVPQLDWRDTHLSWLVLLGRLAPGIERNQARSELQIIAAGLDRLDRGRKTTLTVDTTSLISEPAMRKQVLTASSVVLAGVSLVLMICCANTANLMLARGAHRQREIAVRLSLGASRGRIVNQLVTESVLLSLLGGVIGTLAAHYLFKSFYRYLLEHLPPQLPIPALNLTLDWRIWMYTAGLSMGTGMLFGILPALEGTRIDPVVGLKQGGFRSDSRVRRMLRSSFLGGQVTVCLVLLVAAGLLSRGLVAALRLDPGFETRNVVAATLRFEQSGYKPAAIAAFYDRLFARLKANQDVSAVSLARAIPLSGTRLGDLVKTAGTGEVQASYNEVSSSFFATLDIPLLRGHTFSSVESNAQQAAIVVSESMARRFWPRTDPIGQRLLIGGEAAEVVGVAKDVFAVDLFEKDAVFFYRPLQYSQTDVSVMVRGPHSEAVKSILRREIQAIDPKLYPQIDTLEQLRELWALPGKMLTMLTATLALAALLLATSGVYGVVNYDVNRRMRELGVRMAVGASPNAAFGFIARVCLWPVAVGAVLGIMLALALTQVMSAVLYGVSPIDPGTFAAMGIVLLLAALIAAYLPTRRAIVADPLRALRQD